MSITTVPEGQALALCCTCGSTRTASARYLRRLRDLKCATCGRATSHAPVSDGSRDDWREASNRRADVALQDLQRDLDFVRGMGVEVCFTSTRPEYTGATVHRFVDDGHLRVEIEQTYDVADRHEALRWAWRYLLPSYDGWLNGEVFLTGRDAHQGIHRRFKTS